VLEPLSGYIQLADFLLTEPSRYNGAWNFGPAESDKFSVLDVAKSAVTIWGSGEVKVDQATPKVHEAGLLHLNCEKAQTQMNWSPQWDFEETMFQTVSWYLKTFNKASVRETSESQLAKYMEKLK
jgi:CDP-glucose 4,6-dehydratase